MATLITGLVLAVLVFFVARLKFKQAKNAPANGCGGSCDGCSGCGH